MPQQPTALATDVSTDDGSLRVGRTRSADEIIMRKNLTVGAGLNELDDIKEALDDAVSPPGSPPFLPPGALQTQKKGLLFSEVAAAVLVVALGVFIRLLLWPRSTGAASNISNWLLIVAGLVTLAIVVIGVENVSQIYKDWQTRAPSGMRIPLTDARFSITTVNKFANSAQVREKTLKIIQYVLRGLSYSGYFSKGLSTTLKSLSKTTSIARRFFKFCRWIKHFEDLEEAKGQKNRVMQILMYIRIVNICLDLFWSHKKVSVPIF